MRSPACLLRSSIPRRSEAGGFPSSPTAPRSVTGCGYINLGDYHVKNNMEKMVCSRVSTGFYRSSGSSRPGWKALTHSTPMGRSHKPVCALYTTSRASAASLSLPPLGRRAGLIKLSAGRRAPLWRGRCPLWGPRSPLGGAAFGAPWPTGPRHGSRQIRFSGNRYSRPASAAAYRCRRGYINVAPGAFWSVSINEKVGAGAC